MRSFLSVVVFLVGLSLGFGSAEKGQIVGEWVMQGRGELASSIFEFKPDGRVFNTVHGTEGVYQLLEDGRLFIEFADSVIIGGVELNGSGDSIALAGDLWLGKQMVEVDFLAGDESMKAKAREAGQQMKLTIENSQKQQIGSAILMNLSAVASAAQMHMIMEGKTSVKYSDIVGEGKMIPGIRSVYGEDYSKIEIGYRSTSVEVVDQDGVAHAYEF